MGHRKSTIVGRSREGFEDALRDAVDQFATRRGAGRFDAKVSYEVTIEVTNPGQIGEYRVIVDDG